MDKHIKDMKGHKGKEEPKKAWVRPEIRELDVKKTNGGGGSGSEDLSSAPTFS